jgi:hypothetical protein
LISGHDRGRVRRLKYWITGLTLVPGMSLMAGGLTKAAVGYTIGGMLILLNLVGTERSVLVFVESRGPGRYLVFLLYMGKLVLTAVLIGAALLTEIASPMALMLGVTTLLMALVFDFLVFPRNIENREES